MSRTLTFQIIFFNTFFFALVEVMIHICLITFQNTDHIIPTIKESQPFNILSFVTISIACSHMNLDQLIELINY